MPGFLLLLIVVMLCICRNRENGKPLACLAMTSADDSFVASVAQELEKIDPQYVHSAEESGKMTLDLNPLVLDALAAIKELAIRVSALEGDAKSPASGSSAG